MVKTRYVKSLNMTLRFVVFTQNIFLLLQKSAWSFCHGNIIHVCLVSCIHSLNLYFDSLFFVNLSYDILLQWIEEPTLLVTRFEYANLFHTVTDWYSAYVASRVTGLPYRPNLVFIDVHCVVCVLNLNYLYHLLTSGIFFAYKVRIP